MINSLILIEPFQHYEVLHSLLRMVIATGGSATVITNDFCKNHIHLEDQNLITWHVAASTEEVIQSKQSLLQTASKILFTTIDPNSIFWKWEKSKPQISAYLHNAHSFFDLNKYRVSTLFYKGKYRSYQIRGDYHQQKNILNQLTNVLVPEKKIATHLKSIIPSKDRQKIKTLPFAFPEFPAKIHVHDQINITIPGTISNQLRDYKILFESLQKVDQTIKVSVRLTLLGRLREVAIRTSLEEKSFKNIEIKIFSDYISPKLFEKNMGATDFLLLPIREKVIYKAHHEYRGKSSVSGNINDLAKYGLPAILPIFYPLENSLEMLTGRYSDTESLTKILIEWIANQTFNQLKKKTTVILDTYQKQVLENFKTLFR